MGGRRGGCVVRCDKTSIFVNVADCGSTIYPPFLRLVVCMLLLCRGMCNGDVTLILALLDLLLQKSVDFVAILKIILLDV